MMLHACLVEEAVFKKTLKLHYAMNFAGSGMWKEIQ